MLADGSEWNRPPGSTVWPHDEVHVWRTKLDWTQDNLASLKLILAPDERARVDRFVFEKDQRSHLVSRGCLRLLLSHYLGIPAGELGFTYGARGKPSLLRRSLLRRSLKGRATSSDDQAALQFNVSHSGEWVLIALTAGRALGVDVERMRPDTRVVELADRYFSAHERAALAALAPSRQHDAFFNGWSRKEAYIKAQGAGLSLPLDSFDVTLAPGEPAQLIATRPDAAEARRWSMRAFDVAAGYKAAIVVEGSGWTIKFWDWPPQ